MRRANGMDEFYSRTKGNGGVELFIDKNGQPTIDRPHVHVVHHGNGIVEVIATTKDGGHPWRTKLTNPSGNEVNSAVSTAKGYI